MHIKKYIRNMNLTQYNFPSYNLPSYKSLIELVCELEKGSESLVSSTVLCTPGLSKYQVE